MFLLQPQLKMDFILIFFAALFTLSKGEGGCKELEYLKCRKNKTLTSHVIKSIRVLAPGLEDCQHQCFLEDKCVSYNLGPVNGMIRTCEVNDADHVSDPGHVVCKEDFEYCPIKNPCSFSPCPANQWCAPDFYWNTFKCSAGRWADWSAWSCYCPKTRTRKCVTPLNTAINVCDGNPIDSPKQCKALTNIQGCSEPLGMQDGRIKDNQISASSTFSRNCIPSYGRLHRTKTDSFSDGGWCARQSIIGEYMQIDLETIKWVTKISTQGRNVYDQWVTEYTLSFTNNTSTWAEYQGDQNCTKTFIGNSDQNTVVKHDLPVAVKTRYVRIIVQKWRGHVSMRVEVYGCTSV